jgi:SHS2 domain-containing protein
MAAPTTEAGWEHFEHQADIGVRGRGPTREAAFAMAARALTAVITDPASVGESDRADAHVRIECDAPDAELLLVDWLNALVYEMAVRHLLFARFAVRIEDGPSLGLQGEAWGEPVDIARHRPAVEVKGATYTALRVAQEADGAWVAQCVVDV